MTRYVVKSPEVTVLKKTALVRKEKKLWEITPDAWKQGEYTCITVKNGQEVNDQDYEASRLHALFVSGALELLEGKSVAPESNVAVGNTTEDAPLPSRKGNGKKDEEKE